MFPTRILYVRAYERCIGKTEGVNAVLRLMKFAGRRRRRRCVCDNRAANFDEVRRRRQRPDDIAKRNAPAYGESVYTYFRDLPGGRAVGTYGRRPPVEF